MHEVGMTQDILKRVLERLAASPASQIKQVVLAIGDRSGVDPESVTFYFDMFSQGTPAEGAEPLFQKITAGRR